MSRWWINNQPYTCRNSRFQTDVLRSGAKPHGPGNALGSVFDAPLVDNGGYTLWLEYVEDYKNGNKCFWLMWYDHKGAPTIPASGVFNEDQLRAMNGQLASFIKMP